MVAKLMYSRVGAQCAMPTHARVAPRKLFDYCGAHPHPHPVGRGEASRLEGCSRRLRRPGAFWIVLRGPSGAPQDEGRGFRVMRETRTYGAEVQDNPPRGGQPRLDRRRGRMPARGRPRRRADRDGLRPSGRRNLGCGRRDDLRRQGPAGDQPAHRPCSRPRGGARARRLRPGGRTARQRVLARTAHSGPASRADLPDQPARARRSRHRGAALAGA